MTDELHPPKPKQHTFVGVLEGHDLVYVDVDPWTESESDFPGWDLLAREAAIAQKLMTEADAKRASFMPAARPATPTSYFR